MKKLIVLLLLTACQSKESKEIERIQAQKDSAHKEVLRLEKQLNP